MPTYTGGEIGTPESLGSLNGPWRGPIGQAFYISGEPPSAPVVVDSTPPVVTHVSPAANTAISSSTPLVCEVTDESALRRVIIAIQQGTDAPEVAWDGETFSGPYAAGSSTAAVAGGYRISFVRARGWTGSPLRRLVWAIDTGGNEAS